MSSDYIGLPRLWLAGRQTLESVSGTLGEHWRAAVTRQFWRGPANWLEGSSGETQPDHQRTSGGRLIR
jgi:hypothetical protein